MSFFQFYKESYLVSRKFLKFQVRNLSLLECRSKELLQKYGVKIQRFQVAANMDEAKAIPEILQAKEYVIKAQVLAGGRGLGHFNNGFKGGVHLTKDPNEIVPILSKMIGSRLITKQTDKNGILVKEVMIAESVDIKTETYFCILLDRTYNGPVIIASPAGGTDIEDTAERRPNLIRRIRVDIYKGITEDMALDIADFLQFPPNVKTKAANEMVKLWKVFTDSDAIQVEINPMVQTMDDRIIALDAKIICDDNAAFRQQNIFEKHDFGECDPKEVEAARHNLNYISMDGNIGCLVNGAGLAMATMDIIKLYGGEPANFLDVGGNVNEEQVYHAFHILTSDSNVKSILVNVFGGIVNCATIAKGIINASKDLDMTIPLTVRLEGTNVTEGKSLLENCALNIQFATDLDQAAQKSVQSIH